VGLFSAKRVLSDKLLDRTVDSHIRNLRRKLAEAGASADLIETVFGVGYRLTEGGNS